MQGPGIKNLQKHDGPFFGGYLGFQNMPWGCGGRQVKELLDEARDYLESPQVLHVVRPPSQCQAFLFGAALEKNR